MKVYLIGVGMGNPATLTGQALEAIGDSPVLVGAPRLLEPWGAEHDCVPLIAAADIAAYVDKAPRGPVGVLLSGDTGFYSGAKGLWPLLGNHEVITIPGISSLSYFCARLQTTWQDARLVSAHGRSHNAVGEIQRSAKVFALTGGATKAEDICRALAERGLGQVRVSVGERLSYADERIVTGTAAELAGETFADLSVLLAVNPDPVVRPWNGSGLPDGAFLRGDVPMTKEEVRALALSKLRLEAHHVVWDVGAGTGSVSVECALSCPAGRVYAVEKKEEALALLAENRARFHAANLEVVAGTAPEALEALSAPDRVFLGGTSGSLEDILNVIFRKNPAARVVCTAVTLETVGEAARCFAGLEGADMVQVAVTRSPGRAGHERAPSAPLRPRQRGRQDHRHLRPSPGPGQPGGRAGGLQVRPGLYRPHVSQRDHRGQKPQPGPLLPGPGHRPLPAGEKQPGQRLGPHRGGHGLL